MFFLWFQQIGGDVKWYTFGKPTFGSQMIEVEIENQHSKLFHNKLMDERTCSDWINKATIVLTIMEVNC